MTLVRCEITECIYNNNKKCTKELIHIGFIPYEGIDCYTENFLTQEQKDKINLDHTKQHEFDCQIKYR